jgi:hypothetical protein
MLKKQSNAGSTILSDGGLKRAQVTNGDQPRSRQSTGRAGPATASSCWTSMDRGTPEDPQNSRDLALANVREQGTAQPNSPHIQSANCAMCQLFISNVGMNLSHTRISTPTPHFASCLPIKHCSRRTSCDRCKSAGRVLLKLAAGDGHWG